MIPLSKGRMETNKSTPLKARVSSICMPLANLGEKWILHIVLARTISPLNQNTILGKYIFLKNATPQGIRWINDIQNNYSQK